MEDKRHNMNAAIQDLYPQDFAHCFGCGRNNSEGHQLKSFVDSDEVVARFTPSPSHIAVPGFVYGGLLASLVDCHAMATAAAAAELAAGRKIGDGEVPRYVTAALHVEYLKPTPLGCELEIRGRVTERSEKKAVVAMTISASGVVTVQAEAVAVRIPKSMER
jgi:acyl-coenzyme A thioesterase PaaI-like protein